MFTGNRLRLSEFDGQFGLTVHRDCEFAFVGKVPTLLEHRLVPCSKSEHIEAAALESGIAGIITTAELLGQVPGSLGAAVAETPVVASLFLHEAIAAIPNFQWESFATRIDSSADVHPNATVAERDVVIGPNTVVHPGAWIRERSIIGANCRIGDNVVVGLDALEIFEGAQPRRILKQAGGVWIDDGVEFLAKNTVVRATFGGFTRIGEGTMVDVLIHIAHDVQIGKRVTLVACCEISGRCVLGDDCYIGPNACIRNGVKVGEGAKISIGSVVSRDVPAHTTVTGNFAVEHSKWLSFVKSL